MGSRLLLRCRRGLMFEGGREGAHLNDSCEALLKNSMTTMPGGGLGMAVPGRQRQGSVRLVHTRCWLDGCTSSLRQRLSSSIDPLQLLAPQGKNSNAMASALR